MAMAVDLITAKAGTKGKKKAAKPAKAGKKAVSGK
jgi:hypothetical protein